MRALKGAGMAFCLLSALGALFGCGEKPPGVEDTSHLENPPPKPPNCPFLPELENLKLAKGLIADVRIVRIGETTLYVPKRWLNTLFFDLPARTQSFLERNHGLFSPDLHYDECPGVIHVMNPDLDAENQWLPTININIPTFSRQTGEVIGPDPNLAPSGSIGRLFLVPRKREGQRNFFMFSSSSLQDGRLNYNKDIAVFMSVLPRALESEPRESASVRELINWLATAPKNRDADRVFSIKLDAQ